MNERRVLKAESLGAWVRMLQQSGRQIYAPKKRDQQVDFVRLEPGEALIGLVDDVVQTVQSPKFALFPRVEELFRFGTGKPRLRERQWNDLPEMVLLGVRPCDAAAFSALEAIFMWDTTDAPFKKRKEKLFVVGLSCRQADEYCFCTSLGGGPGDSRGSDILLTRMDNGDFLVEVVSGRGKSLVQLAEDLFAPAAAVDKDKLLAKVEKVFDSRQLEKKLTGLFAKEKLWEEQSLRCIGCGACAYVCPTCACFDIQDEGLAENGQRLRCWDSCGFSLFTLHASGHNPRHLQSQRWRQRLLHKFSYMPERLGLLGCVGCGRCSRACPVDMNLREHLRSALEERP